MTGLRYGGIEMMTEGRDTMRGVTGSQIKINTRVDR
jgi:hypothetical protein